MKTKSTLKLFLALFVLGPLAHAENVLEEPLLMQLLSTDRRTSQSARTVLQMLPKESQLEIAPYLVLGLKDADARVRKEAVQALACVGMDTSIRVGRALRKALEDQNEDVRSMALLALQHKSVDNAHLSFRQSVKNFLSTFSQGPSTPSSNF